MLRLVLLIVTVLTMHMPLSAAERPFTHKPKHKQIKQSKDPVSRKEQSLPKTFVLKPTRTRILGQESYR
ncbi:MAG TPA: hypothetical protein PKE03_04565 [Bacteroidales bacterium]|nr:hypothetical protein [Bacteroidales bacterium]